MPQKKETIAVSLGQQPVERVDRWKAAAEAVERPLLRWAALQLDAAAKLAEKEEGKVTS